MQLVARKAGVVESDVAESVEWCVDLARTPGENTCEMDAVPSTSAASSSESFSTTLGGAFTCLLGYHSSNHKGEA